MSVSKIVAAAASSAGGAGLDVDEVFSTYLYTGTGSTQTITNGIDFTEGGLLWIKGRTDAYSHYLHDTTTSEPWHFLQSNNTDARNTHTGNEDLTISAFNSNGFVLGSGSGINNGWGGNNSDFTSWSFRKAPKFFDVVTFSATGSGSLTLSHNLGSSPAFIIVKSTSHSQSWYCYHHSLNGGTDPEDYFLKLDSNVAEAGPASSYWGGTAPTSTQFTVGTDLNISGRSYVAYLFAHNNNDGGFGPDSDQDIIKCGSYTGNGSTSGPTVNLGFEPQWIMIKDTTSAHYWMITDVMRGIPNGVANSVATLKPNGSDAEFNAFQIDINATGFQIADSHDFMNKSGNTYIYMAIRRGPLAAPDDATKVFEATTSLTGARQNGDTISTTLDYADWHFFRRTDRTDYNSNNARITGWKYLSTNTTDAETTAVLKQGGDQNKLEYTGSWHGAHSNVIDYFFKRAPSYFDVCCYSGTGSARTVPHNLGLHGAVPEMMWVRNRTTGNENWAVYHKDLGAQQRLQLNNTEATGSTSTHWNSTAPTNAVFTVGTHNSVNQNTDNYIAYLFATVAGVSKVGSVSHTSGSTTNVDCGFSSGARFVILKASSIASQWMVFDTVRGIVSGVSPFLRLNQTGAEVTSTDIIDPYSTGFAIDPTVSTATYIFYAIA